MQGFVCKRFLPSPPLPSPTPLFRFLALAPFFALGKTQKNLFLGLSVLPNPTEMLAMQADICFLDWLAKHEHKLMENTPEKF